MVQVKDKAVKVDYDLEPCFNGSVVVYTRTCWVPKSVLVADKNGIGFEVKKWFANKFQGGPFIKKYFMEGNKQIFA